MNLCSDTLPSLQNRGPARDWDDEVGLLEVCVTTVGLNCQFCWSYLSTALAVSLRAFLERINYGRRPALHMGCIFLMATRVKRG